MSRLADAMHKRVVVMPTGKRKTGQVIMDYHRLQFAMGEFPMTLLCDDPADEFAEEYPWEPGYTCPEAEAASNAEDRI